MESLQICSIDHEDNHINISVSNGEGSYKAELYDVGGALQITSVLLQDTKTIEVPELANGVYFLIVKDSTGILYREKVVLVK